jgi:gluconokinase
MSMAASPPVSDFAGSRRLILVMGVSGCGKSSVGASLAAGLGLAFVEGDTLHPKANVEKMSKGIALGDADRWPWLEEIGAALRPVSGAGVVLRLEKVLSGNSAASRQRRPADRLSARVQSRA